MRNMLLLAGILSLAATSVLAQPRVQPVVKVVYSECGSDAAPFFIDPDPRIVAELRRNNNGKLCGIAGGSGSSASGAAGGGSSAGGGDSGGGGGSVGGR